MSSYSLLQRLTCFDLLYRVSPTVALDSQNANVLRVVRGVDRAPKKNRYIKKNSDFSYFSSKTGGFALAEMKCRPPIII